MPYTTVVPSTTITAAWGNANVRDQVITPFANAAARTSTVTAPVDGQYSHLTDVDRLEFYDGASSLWRPAINNPHCQLQQVVGQSITSGVTTPVTFTSADADALSWHNNTTNTSRVVPNIPGWYQVSGKVGWVNTSATGRRTTLIGKNGTAVPGSEHAVPALNSSNYQSVVSPTIEVYCNGSTDYIELLAVQDAGGPISTSIASASAQSFLSVRLVRVSSN